MLNIFITSFVKVNLKADYVAKKQDYSNLYFSKDGSTNRVKTFREAYTSSKKDSLRVSAYVALPFREVHIKI